MDDWEDDFGGAPQQGGAGDPLVGAEYARMEKRYTDAGYREGITDGKLATLQAGFDEGFAASVPPARRMGQLRGRANALLAIALAANTDAQVVDSIRELVAALGAVKRDDVLPPDLERAAHEAEHHPDDENAFELDPTPAREMEGLEDALGAMGGKKPQEAQLREDKLLDHLEQRVVAAEKEILGTA